MAEGGVGDDGWGDCPAVVPAEVEVGGEDSEGVEEAEEGVVVIKLVHIIIDVGWGEVNVRILDKEY